MKIVVFSKKMRNFIPLYVVFFILLSVQFTVSNGGLMCYYIKSPECYKLTERFDGYCSGSERTIQCLKRKAIQCDASNSTVVLGVQESMRDACLEGTELNKAYLKHKHCVSEVDSNVHSCYQDFRDGVRNYPRSGDKERDKWGMFRLSCRYVDRITDCISEEVREACGEEAQRFYLKFVGAEAKLIEYACTESSASTFGLAWTRLLQAAAVLVSLGYFSLAK